MRLPLCVGSAIENLCWAPARRIWRGYPRALRQVLKGSALLVLLPAFLASGRPSPWPQAKHPVTLRDLLSLRGGNMTPRLSPDGRWLAYVANKEIWILSTQPGGVPREIGKGFLPQWSPQGTRLAYYSSQSGALQLWLFDLRTNRAQQITHLTGGIDPDPWTRMTGYFNDAFRFSWSPDGSRLVFASRVSPIRVGSVPLQARRAAAGNSPQMGMPLILTDTTPADWTLSGIFSHGFGAAGWKNGEVSYESSPSLLASKLNQLFLVDIRTKSIRQLTAGSAGYFDPNWSPDGSIIVCVSSDGKSLENFSSVPTNIYSVYVRTGRRIPITTGSGDKFMPFLSPDGKWIAYHGGKHFGIGHVFVVPAAGGQGIPIPPLDRYTIELQWSPDSKSLVVIYRDGVTAPVAQVDIETGAVKVLSGPDDAYRMSLAVSQSGSIAWQESGPYTAGVIRILRAHEHTPSLLVDLNPQIKEWELGEQEVVRWKNHHGDEMEGVLLLPVGYQKGLRYPLIVDAYPMQQNDLKGALSGNQAWASRGYAVFWPNAPAPHVWPNAFTTEAYSQSAKGPEGWEVTRDDVMSGVDELIRRGIVDPSRMGLYGFSNGGGVVNYLVTQTTRFKCGVSVAGAVSDWLRPALLETDLRAMELLEGGADPWSDPEPYIRLSAIFRLNKVTTPMLLADGDEDGDFLLNTIEMYNGLRWFGKNVTLLRYPGQEHGFTGAALRDFWRRENAFFDKYLKPLTSRRIDDGCRSKPGRSGGRATSQNGRVASRAGCHAGAASNPACPGIFLTHRPRTPKW
jgi:dipeptidyl aminopeptidase/acylaminoacyl peptidase